MIRCIAIDDEPIALRIISEYCRRHGDITLETFTSPVAGMERIRATRPDIVFLDIELNSCNGLQLARSLPEGTSLIFTTAYPEYALEGFEVNAVDFLHKPIFYPRFLQALEKAVRWGAGRPSSPETITLKAGYKNVPVRPDEIKYIEAMDNYVKIYRLNLPMIVAQITMKEIATLLPEEKFVRVHRSYIVSIPFIESYTNRQLTLRDTEIDIPVGRKYLHAIQSLKSISHQSD